MRNQQPGHGQRSLSAGKGVHKGGHPNKSKITVKGGPHHGGNGVKKVPHIHQHQKGQSMQATPKTDVLPKLYVLDTNVLMHDPTSLLQFQEHDIYIPTMVLRELDDNKKGHEEVARNSRATSRFIDALIKAMEERDPKWKLRDGLSLELAEGGKPGMGRIFIQSEEEENTALRMLSESEKRKGDNHIVAVSQMLLTKRAREYSQIRLVTKDINMRILARGRELLTDDYTNDLVNTDADKGIYSGMVVVPHQLIKGRIAVTERNNSGDNTLSEIEIPNDVSMHVNELLIEDNAGANAAGWMVTAVQDGVATIRHCKNYMSKLIVQGIHARNREQNFLMNMLMDPELHFVTILGAAGTGKTLLAVLAALEQKHNNLYNGIIFTRATVPVGEDIGFLPGDEREKMGPWVRALEDNLEVILEASESKHSPEGKLRQLAEKHSRTSAITDLAEDITRSNALTALLKQFKLQALTFMRGRTFLTKFVIIDEAQNLTPKQMKTLITRAGPGTKVICLGNLDQIDTPYLTDTSSGLSYVIDRFKGWEHYGHITLTRNERSPLADHAVKVL